MKIINKPLMKICQLHRDETIPPELIEAKNSVSMVAQDGQLFRLQNTGLYSVLSEFQLNNVKDLEVYLDKTLGERVYSTDNVYLLANRFKDHPLPSNIIRYVMKYFREIYAKYKSECAVMLMFNETTLEWRLLITPQVNASHGGVRWLMPRTSTEGVTERDLRDFYDQILEDPTRKELMLKCFNEYSELGNQGFSVFGTIHSHCDFSAFHSGTDDADEFRFDGLHITIGHVNTSFSFACRFMLQRCDFPREITAVTDCSLEDLTKDIDTVQIDPYHMDLFMPDIHSRTVEAPKFEISSTATSKSHQFSLFNEEIQIEGGIEPYVEVFEEQEFVRLFDVIDGKVIWVKASAVEDEGSGFGNSKLFIRLDTGEIPEVCKAAHAKVLETRKEDEDEEIVEASITILDDALINPAFSPEDNVMGYRSSTIVDPKDLVPKATKKVKA